VIDDSDPFATEEVAASTVTKEDVRTALVTYQTKKKEKLLAGGADENTAKTEAMNAARKLLATAGGADNLGALVEAKYAAVIDAAVKASAAV
jgi:hypothetical protein